MSTYEEFIVILTVALLIVAILNYIKKTVSKAALLPSRNRRLYLAKYSPGRIGFIYLPAVLLSILYIMTRKFKTKI